MNRSEILTELERLNKLHWDRDDYTIVYGAALVLWGIVETTNDIDITTSDDGFRYLNRLGFVAQPYKGDRGNMYYRLTDCITIFHDSSLSYKGGYSVNRINGFYVMGRLGMLREYISRGRSKDIDHAQLLWDWLHEHNMVTRMPRPTEQDIIRPLG